MRHMQSIARIPRTFLKILFVMFIGSAALPALAWPDKPVRMLVPAPAGGTIDVMARLVAKQLTADNGQPVIVENRPGAGGAIATQAMLAAPADGYTIMMTNDNVLTEVPHVMKTAFDPLKDVRPVVAVARAGIVLVGATSLQAQDFKALVTYLKANPGKLSFASYSAGTASHYAGLILNQKFGLDLQHVPFAGSPPALQQVMGGRIAVMFDGIVTSMPLIIDGKLKAYGVAAKSRLPQLPEVPTFAELGLPELGFSNWYGVVVSEHVPLSLVNRINAAVSKAGAASEVHDRLISLGFEPAEVLSSAQLQQLVRSDFDRNGAIVKDFNIVMN